MNRNHARLASYDLVTDDSAEEISSVRQIPVFDLPAGVEVGPESLDRRLDLDIGVDINGFALDRNFDDPTPVYARPYNLIGGNRLDFTQHYFLGTRFNGGIIESATWEQEIRAAGASELVIAQCRRYLSENAL